ncbi:YdcP family protein [Enterococcus gilvus]|uniref:Conjugative transposon protein n=1 Tax=Enterococcus gilvus ATCC BAA-350 TaxID=1158614 RepID=R2VCS9_9ENTE|nr:YdcP family protein [Enterococcus gilvus]EOI55485.1 conjugative transposon protein [Enterococcus gilvus ATCC BAA-350]EOW81972.1 conjugative transposon protein [Enterococcus gilvus ATCC BAA-350]OJG43002.1 conjugative transposon protein [Enterococcus gilvus]
MRLAEGIIVDNEKTFGVLKFSALRREVFERDSDGELTEKVKERTYDLKSSGQKQMIQVSVPASKELKEFAYNDEVELIDPVVDTVANPTFRGADVDWYIKCADIITVKKSPQTNQQESNKNQK